MLIDEPAGLKFEEKSLNPGHPVHFHTHEYREDQAIRMHYHSSLEVNLILGAQGFVQMEGRSIALDSFSLLILPPGNLHSYRIQGLGGFIDVWHMGLDCFKYLNKDELLDLIRRISGILILKSPDESLLESLSILKSGSLIEKNSAFLMFLNHLNKYLIPGSFQTPKDEFLHGIIRYLEANYRNPISLNQAAEHVHLSRYHFCRKFKARTGSTFLEYLNNLRLEHSLIQLNKGESVERCAEHVGFEETSYFIKRFKGLYGITPGVYQRFLRQE
jgi:AraC-like DNA-binding protein